MAEASVLIVEDDRSLRRSLAATLRAAGYKPIEAGSIAEAQRMRAHLKPDLILLDLGLPDGEGLDFITAVRVDALTPIVVLSARDAEATKVKALDRGADDYITKPFGVDEALARLRAAARHAVQAAGSPPIVRTGSLEIDLAARIVRKQGEEVDLSQKEFDVLAVLAQRIGQVVRHGEILDRVWGSASADIQYLRVYIGQLRAKLEDDPAEPRYLKSDSGVGYRLLTMDGSRP
jgi:two-component system KDP operon response regulator KdpE